VSILPIYNEIPSMAEALKVYTAAGFDISGMFPVTTEVNTGRVLEFDCTLVNPDMAEDGLPARPAVVHNTKHPHHPSTPGNPLKP
jgi:hypothetical protein